MGPPSTLFGSRGCRLSGALGLILALLLTGCASASGPRETSFQNAQVRQATRLLNTMGAEAKPYVEGACTPVPDNLRKFCRALRALYKGALGLALGIDDAMNAADATNRQAVDLDKVLEVGFRLLDLATEEEAATRAAMKGVP